MVPVPATTSKPIPVEYVARETPIWTRCSTRCVMVGSVASFVDGDTGNTEVTYWLRVLRKAAPGLTSTGSGGFLRLGYHVGLRQFVVQALGSGVAAEEPCALEQLQRDTEDAQCAREAEERPAG